MIRYVGPDEGSILDDPADVLVCPVNLVSGVMGKGLALAFKERWPNLVDAHKMLCQIRYGGYETLYYEQVGTGQLVCLFPTKVHWRNPSKLELVARGMRLLVENVKKCKQGTKETYRIAVPALGCGLGGLHWDRVKPLIELAELQTDDVSWAVYLPR